MCFSYSVVTFFFLLLFFAPKMRLRRLQGPAESDGRCLSSHFPLTAAEEQTAGDRFLHVFIEDGSPVARLGCGGGLVLNAAAERNVDNGRWMNITVR